MRFQQEDFSSIYPEIAPLMEINFRETGADPSIPLDLNKELIDHVSKLGSYKLFTARTDSGELVGYCGMYVSFNMHFKSSKQASQDVIFIHPDHRGFGLSFIKWIDQQLKELGVEMVYQSVTEKFDWSLILKRIGYQKAETLYSRRLN